jgi:predicted flap endonuclease-1-like 5' DNA nuclease
MLTMIEANWPIAALVVVAVLVLAWLLLGRGRADRRERHRAPDALDEGAAPARRNSALINAPSATAQVNLGDAAITAASFADTGPSIMVGIGEVVAAAAAREANAARDTGEYTEAAAIAPALPAEISDDLTRIKGLGPKLKARLADLGVVSFAQIAAWSETDIAGVDAQLGSFAGRATRDQWVAQAAFLANGDVAGYEAKFGKL